MTEVLLPNPLKAVILDMDGVLVDTEPLHIESFCLLMDEMGIDYETEYVHGFVGFSIADNIRRINDDFFPDSELDIEQCVQKRDQLYLDLIRSQELKPMTGIPELIDLCNQKKITLALASSSDRLQIDEILDNLKQNGQPIRSRLATIVSGNDVRRRKPFPDIYRLALNRLNLKAGEVIAVEDSPAGVQSALEAGLFCAAITSPYIPDHELKRANAVFTSISALTEHLR